MQLLLLSTGLFPLGLPGLVLSVQGVLLCLAFPLYFQVLFPLFALVLPLVRFPLLVVLRLFIVTDFLSHFYSHLRATKPAAAAADSTVLVPLRLRVHLLIRLLLRCLIALWCVLLVLLLLLIIAVITVTVTTSDNDHCDDSYFNCGCESHSEPTSWCHGRFMFYRSLFTTYSCCFSPTVHDFDLVQYVSCCSRTATHGNFRFESYDLHTAMDDALWTKYGSALTQHDFYNLLFTVY